MENASLNSKVMMMESNIEIEDVTVKLDIFRKSFLGLLRSMMKNCKFLKFCTTLGKMCSTVQNVDLKTIVYDISTSIHSLLCGKQAIIHNIPTISVTRKYNYNY
jgi:hypothetical protein